MKHFIIIMMALIFSIGASAQSVKKEGNTFVQVTVQKEKQQPTKTKYTFKAKDGKEYPIYVSNKGKAFIVKVSKKTGKEYRQYLPEVTEQLKGKENV